MCNLHLLFKKKFGCVPIFCADSCSYMLASFSPLPLSHSGATAAESNGGEATDAAMALAAMTTMAPSQAQAAPPALERGEI